MSAFRRKLLEAADTHRSLISQIADLEHAPSALKQQTVYLNNLNSTLKTLKTELKKLRATTTKEQNQHQDLRNSFARRYAYSLTGRSEKFTSRIEKEEKEYLEASRDQKLAEEKERYLEETVAETTKQVSELTLQAKEYDNLKLRSDQLYQYVFEGPNPEFPEEDRMEHAVKNSEELVAKTQSRYTADCEAGTILVRTEKVVSNTVGYCKTALSAATWDLWGGGTLADMIERDNLRKAEVSLVRVEMLLDQAMALQRAIGPFSDVKVASGHIIGDIIFDNPISDYKFREKIKKTNAQIIKLHGEVKVEIQKQAGRTRESRINLENATSQLAIARKELENVRREVFERVTGVQCTIKTPPAYDLTSPVPMEPVPEFLD
ncbi:hypothetical protein ABW20_dc0102411 [Dactylellina cionopaga]|nr:hypothetical protein ABW20_dc0102411 [Dactylellina cionopaga]